MIKIKKKTFSGTSKVFSGELSEAIRGLAQYQAAVKLDTAAVTALTNSAGGSANGTINAIGNVTPAVLGSTDCAQKAGFETALGTVKDAISEIVAKLNAIRAVVPAFSALTDSTGGTAADGTVAAVTVSLTGVGTSLASAAGSQAVVSALKDAISQARYFTNLAANAVGVTPLVDNSGHVGPVSTTFAAISTSTGTAVSGASLSTPNAAVKEADGEAVLTALRDGITELAAKVNEVINVTPSLAVVAG
jgi:hypothetical protein